MIRNKYELYFINISCNEEYENFYSLLHIQIYKTILRNYECLWIKIVLDNHHKYYTDNKSIIMILYNNDWLTNNNEIFKKKK